MNLSETRGWASKPIVMYAGLVLLLLALGAWLASDISHERERILSGSRQLAVDKSQLINRAFGETFLAADYVLRDVLGRNNPTSTA